LSLKKPTENKENLDFPKKMFHKFPSNLKKKFGTPGLAKAFSSSKASSPKQQEVSTFWFLLGLGSFKGPDPKTATLANQKVKVDQGFGW